MGISLHDLDLVSVGFLIEIMEERNNDVEEDETIEATPEMVKSFFR